jgi:hypothetical protein
MDRHWRTLVAYSDKFDRSIELDVTEAQALVVKLIMREGELRFRDALIETLQSELKTYLAEVDYEPNMEWVEGVRYAIHIIKEADLDESIER